MNGTRRLVAIAALLVLPWSLIFAGDALTLVFPFGLVDPRTLHLTDVVSYTTVHTGGLPGYLFAWPVGSLLYLGALASAAAGVLLDREDRRVTAGLLVLAGFTQLSFAWGFTRRIDTVAVPLGTILAWTVVWWFDWPAVRAALSVGE
jgi:uncharacterized protein (TIGR04206 family)